VLILAGLLVASILQGASSVSAAELWIVDDSTPGCPGVDFSTIQEAVDHPDVDPGDFIKVCPGVYPETVTVTKRLIFQGPQVGVDARNRPGAETTEAVLDAPGGAFDVRVDGVAIDGFWIKDATDPGWGARFDPNHSGYRFVNNIVEDNMFGIYLNSKGETESVVQWNRFRNNNWPGEVGEPLKADEGIYSDLGLANVVIDSNRFTGHVDDAIFLNGRANRISHFDVTISNNSLLSDNSIALLNTQSALIIDNLHDHSQGSAVFVGGGVRGLDIVGNEMRDGVGRGVNISREFCNGDFCTEPEPNADIRINDNQFKRNALRAIDVADGRYVGILDGRYNWWGDVWGPRGWGIGAGDAVSAHVNFFPWAVDTEFERFTVCGNRFRAGSDIVDGTSGNDILCGGGGDDIIRARGGNDLLIGGSGSDELKGGAGNDAQLGGTGHDLLRGGAGFDSLQGWQDVDLCLLEQDGGQTATCES
jgi:Ca2+-binding RTX toxin-like protein